MYICKYILYIYISYLSKWETYLFCGHSVVLIGNFGFTVRGWGLPSIDDIPISCRKRNTNQWNMQGKDSIGAYPPFLGQNYTCMQHASIFAYHGHQKARICVEKKQLPKQHETPWIHWIISPFVSIIWILNRHPVSIKVNPKFQLWTWEFSPMFFCEFLPPTSGTPERQLGEYNSWLIARGPPICWISFHHAFLVGGFNPIEKIWVKLGSSSPNKDENEKNVWVATN